jgi:hypothetical protein
MSLPSKNADLYRRIRLYAFGFLLGILAVKFLYKGKGCQLPSSNKMEELSWKARYHLAYSDDALYCLQCRNMNEAQLKQVLKSGKIDYTNSDVHAKPYGKYFVSGMDSTKKERYIIIENMDTISKFVGFYVPANVKMAVDTCKCKDVVAKE